MTGILSIDSHMNDGTYVMAVVPFCPNGIHHLRIAYADRLISHASTNTMTGYLLHLGYLATVGSLFWEGIAEGCADGVSREVFYMGGEVQQLVLIVKIRVDGLDGKLSVGEGTRLVEDGRIDLGQDVHIVGPLDEDTLA